MMARILSAGVLLALGAITLTGCGKPLADNTPPSLPPVTVSRPVSKVVTDYFEFPGQTAAVGEVEVRARVTGYIDSIHFTDGQEVKKGELLYTIDPRPYEAILNRAKAELARLEATLEKAHLDLARSERMLPSGAVSKDEFEQHATQLKTTEADILAAEAAIYDAELNVGFTKVTSPIDGRVSRRYVTEGNLVQSGSNQSTVLTTVVTTNPIYVDFRIDENAFLLSENVAKRAGQEIQLDRIKELKIPVEVGLADEEGFPHKGLLDFMDNKISSSTGTLRARGVFDNLKDRLMPGLFVRVRIPYGKPHEALLLPEKAILRDQKQKFVYVVNSVINEKTREKEDVVEYRQVKLGPLIDGMRAIESGIKPEDWIIVNGMQRARPKAVVAPHEEKGERK
jgi:RND family efflux transporter MFP subunit